MARPLRRGEPLIVSVLTIGATLAAMVACVPAAERPSGDHPASARAPAAQRPEPAAALGPRYAVDAGPVEPAVLAEGPARLPGVGVPPSRPLSADGGALRWRNATNSTGVEHHHGH